MQRRTVLLVRSDDYGWTELRSTLDAVTGVCVVGEVSTMHQAFRLASDQQPDVVIAAAHLAGESTLPLLSELRHRISPSSKLVVIGTRCRVDEVVEFAALDLAGHLLWGDIPHPLLLHCLTLAIHGDLVIGSQEVAASFLATQLNGKGNAVGTPVLLTKREAAVLRHLTEGLIHEEIARIECCSRHTVERAVAALKLKLDAPSPVVIGARAQKLGLLD